MVSTEGPHHTDIYCRKTNHRTVSPPRRPCGDLWPRLWLGGRRVLPRPPTAGGDGGAQTQ